MKKSSSMARGARLFAEPERPPTHAAGACIANIDGAARGNPGPASYGVIMRKPEGEVITLMKKYIGRNTNNVAEYYALIAALDYAAAHGIHALRIRSDSELLVRQMQGRYKVKSPDLRPLYERAKKMSQALAFFAVEHVPRDQNREADALANQALDATGSRPGARSESAPASPGGALAAQGRKHERGDAKGQKLRIRAHYSGGVLVPAGPLSLPGGTDLEIEIHLPSREQNRQPPRTVGTRKEVLE